MDGVRARSKQLIRPAMRVRRLFGRWGPTTLLLVIVWSTALFEIGLDFFIDAAGVSIHLASSAFFAAVAIPLALVSRVPKSVVDSGERAILGAYAIYWLIAWGGVLYTPLAAYDAGLFACLQYTWYSAVAVLSLLLMHRMPLDHRRRLIAVIGGVSVLVLLAFVMRSVMTGVAVSTTVRDAGRFSVAAYKDYNVFTFAMLLGACLAFVEPDSRRALPSRRSIVLYGLVILGSGILGVLAGSRRSLVLYLPIALLVPSVLLLARSRTRFLSGTIASFATMVILALALPLLLQRSALVLEEAVVVATEQRAARAMGFITGDYADMSSRTERWSKASALYDEYSFVEKLIGRGTRAYYAEEEFVRAGYGRDTPHNFVLAALLEGGVMKLLSLVAFLGLWIVQICRISRHQSFWVNNLIMTGTIMWVTSVLISGEEFFANRHFVLLMVAYFAVRIRHSASNHEFISAEATSSA